MSAESEFISVMSFDNFIDMFFVSDLEARFGVELAVQLNEIREMFIMVEATKKIADFTQLDHEDFALEFTESKFLKRLESVTGLVIVMNAAVIGISTDLHPTWGGWNIFEACFTFFFMFEMAAKMKSSGIWLHFFGNEWHWNWFDACVVGLAVVGLLASLPNTPFAVIDVGNFTIVRIMRLARLTRLLRLLRLKIFKELTLIVNGVFAGMRTLLWAIILLMSVIYCLGVLLAQTIGAEDAPCGPSRKCTSIEEQFDADRQILFSNVGRSMFTAFRCFTDDCSNSSGSSLMLVLWEIYGWPLAVGYVFCLLFVCFGLFNLIMANFVESTMENARFDEQRRHQLRRAEHIHVAQKLQKLMVKLCVNKTSDAGRQSDPSTDVQITRVEFDNFVALPEVNVLLDDLDVSASNRTELFDILDANRSGSLDVQEIIAGLMKVRGPADKSDMVAALLGVRAVHQHLQLFEQLVTRNLKNIWTAIADRSHLEVPGNDYTDNAFGEKVLGADATVASIAIPALPATVQSEASCPGTPTSPKPPNTARGMRRAQTRRVT
eukprot:TRINITY_DN16906_c0_g2_i1.p1 TRINITY_DN16906_c0_g2~~TRINITY_DN16906_c0_g2_i1.p1  ORF type:complete len:549 (-),score=92.45 TRINITY_DN16906_c0_g2_i1:110-1756(-)